MFGIGIIFGVSVFSLTFLEFLYGLVVKMSASTSENPGKKAKTPAKPTIDYDAVIKALKAVKINKRSFRVASKSYELSTTSLNRYIKKFDEEEKDITQLTDDQINAFVRKNEPLGAHRMVF